MARSKTFVASQQQQRVNKINTTNNKRSSSNENQNKIQLSLMTKFRILRADLSFWYPVTSKHIFDSDDLEYEA